MPLLLSALETWTKRAREGQPVRRVLGDVTRELEQRSGLDLGPHPDRWLAWWSNVRTGQTSPIPDEADGNRSRATFFGLRPSSDRVVLILDRSGSMAVPFVPKGRSSTNTKNRPWTRHDEVLHQLESYLSGLSPKGRFNLVVFGDQARVWRSNMQIASESQIRAGQAWAKRHTPKGGTHLHLGIQAALGIDRDGELDPDELEVDTLVVLCDGKSDIGGRIKLGTEVLVVPNVTLRASNHEFRSREKPIREQGHHSGTILVGDDVWIAGNRCILPDVEIGVGAVIGAGSVATKDVEPYSIVAGVPARQIAERQ